MEVGHHTHDDRDEERYRNRRASIPTAAEAGRISSQPQRAECRENEEQQDFYRHSVQEGQLALRLHINHRVQGLNE